VIVAPLSGVQVFGRANGRGEKTSTERRIGDDPDTELPAGWQYLRFQVAAPQRIFALQRRQGLDCMCSSNGVGPGLADTSESDLSLFDKLRYRTEGFLDRNFPVNTVLVVEVDSLDPEAYQACLTGLLYRAVP